MATTTEQEKLILSWNAFEQLTGVLVERIGNQHFDVLLGITRGGLTLTAKLAYRLNQSRIVTAAVRNYNDDNQRLPEPELLYFPQAYIFAGKTVLVVDDVWDSGLSIALVCRLIRQAGGTPLVATLYYKPGRSKVTGQPDFYAAETETWIDYPWESDNGN